MLAMRSGGKLIREKRERLSRNCHPPRVPSLYQMYVLLPTRASYNADCRLRLDAPCISNASEISTREEEHRDPEPDSPCGC